MSEILNDSGQPEHSYDPEDPSFWYRTGIQDAIEGAPIRVLETKYTQFQADYDEGYSVGGYDNKILNRETI